jgi:hypothetical protein
MTHSLTPASQLFSPAKAIFTGIGILLGVSLPKLLDIYPHNTQLSGCEGCRRKPRHNHAPI